MTGRKNIYKLIQYIDENWIIAGGIFDSDEMIQRAFEISIKAVNKNITVSEDAMGVLLTPRTEKINKNAFHVAKIGIYYYYLN